MGWKYDLFKTIARIVGSGVSKSFDIDYKTLAAGAIGLETSKKPSSRQQTLQKVSDRTGYEGFRRPYDVRETWRILGTPQHHSSVQFWSSTVKHHDVWSAEGVDVSWVEDVNGKVSDFHTKITYRNGKTEIFGKKMGVYGPVTFV